MVEWLFWGVAGLIAFGGLGLALAPMWRGARGAEGRASYDMQVFRDQLREIRSDRERGVLSPAEAAASTTEVSRRLLAAAEAEAAQAAAAEAAVSGAPARLSRRTAAALVGLGSTAAAALYLWLGAPGLPDQPQAERLAQAAAARSARPDQAQAEAMLANVRPPAVAAEDEALVARLRAVLADRPTDVEGRRLLARSLAAMQRWSEARAAQADLVGLLGDAAGARDFADLAEFGILAAGGYVSPESETALAKALTLDPGDAASRYYSALALMQGGRPDLAYPVFARLLSEGPADAPWAEAVRAGMAEAAQQTGMPPPADPAPGPEAADIEAAAQMPPEERQAMIEGMVERLGERLAAEGGPPEDWARLVRALGVLGRQDEAAAVLAEARVVHAGDPGLAAIEAAAREAGIAP
jgi:cytochrome c-type biogenesis protein CcmH